ncbi:RNA polymerase sigma factor [Rhizobium sp. TRM95111]|uniref:RNA polymerase sigma factor n=1 Tax=Rhizobium alarense TaxID=2846851 RepID=UPI001F323A0A|nr:RNA polymerase sigma factor [Rhizobium alarense]MCF3640556.1 RNA polymerase sigma factor [Rhizobium alarense]
MSSGPEPSRRTDEAGFSSPASFEGALLGLVPQLRRYAQSLSRSSADGEDLLQDCVEKALVNRGQWRGVNLRAWIFSIMTNLHRNRHRAAAGRTTVDIEAAEQVAATEAGADPLEVRRLRYALDTLGADARAVLMLVVVEGYSYQETADLVGVPIGTVMSRLSRARRQLAEALAKDNIVTLRRAP